MSNLNEIYEEEKAEKKLNSGFITIDEGESFEGEFVKVEKTEGNFGKTKQYTFLIDGEEKVFDKKSWRLLENMKKAGVKPGDIVKITAQGDGFKRTYLVDVLESKDSLPLKPKKKEA